MQPWQGRFVDDPPCKSTDDRCLADARRSDQQYPVVLTPAQYGGDAGDLSFAPNHGIDFGSFSKPGQVTGKMGKEWYLECRSVGGAGLKRCCGRGAQWSLRGLYFPTFLEHTARLPLDFFRFDI